MKKRTARGAAPSAGGWRYFEMLPAVVFLLALSLRAVYSLQTAGEPLFGTPLFEAQGYCVRADDWIRGHGLSPEVFEFSLGYHLFLSACFFLTDGSVAFARGMQIMLGALVCAGVAWATRRLCGRKAGWLAGLLAAGYGPAILLDFQLVPTTLECAWCAALLLLAIPSATKSRREFLRGLVGGAGLLLGARYFAAWLVFAAANRFAGTPSSPPPAESRRPALFRLLGLAVPPTLALALFLGGWRLERTRARLGTEAYLANSGDLCRTLTLRPGPDYLDFLETATVAAQQRNQSVGSYLMRETAVQIGRQPLRWARDLGTKALHLVCSREIPGALDIRAYRAGSPVTRALLWQAGSFGFPFGVVIVLAAAGLVDRFRGLPRALPAMIATLAIPMVLLRVTAPVRMPWVVLLFPLAGAGGFAVAGALGKSARARAPAVLAAAMAALALAWLPGPFCVEQVGGPAELFCALGQERQQSYDMANAGKWFSRALAANPNEARAWNGLGTCYRLDGRLDDAQRAFAKAVELKPRYALALFNLAALEASRGHADKAIGLFEQGLALQPYNDKAHNDLAMLYARRGDLQQARDHLATARRQNPAVLDVRVNLGEVLLALDDVEGAMAELLEASQMAPRHARTYALMGLAMIRAGREGESEGYFRAAQELEPRKPETFYGLALAAALRNAPADAYAFYTNGLALDKGAGLSLLTTNEQARLKELQPAPGL